MATRRLDDTDRRILQHLRLEARMPNSELASKVGLSQSACLRRVKLLEREGIIRGYTAIIAGAGPEEGLDAIVQVDLDRQTEAYLTRFENAVRKHPEVQEWYLMTGTGDYLLRVRVADMEEYGRFHRDTLSKLPGVSRITSSFAMRSNRRG